MNNKLTSLLDVSIGKGEYGIGAPAVNKSNVLPTYLRITDINDDGTINFSGLKSVDADGYKKYLLEYGDVVFARTGNSTGRSYVYRPKDGNFVYAGFLIKFKLNISKVIPEYFRYTLLSSQYKNWIKGNVTGSTRSNINVEGFGKFTFKLPEISEQKRIADILTALDDKIELNNQMNQTLEEIASLLYKRWFVDFEFPDDKGNPYKSSGGEMVDSELGMIPKGWEVKELGEFITLINGYAFKSGSYSKDGNYKIITIKNVLDNKFITNSTNKILEIPDNVIENQKLKIGDVLISLTGNVGRVCVVTEGECLLNQRVAKIISKIEVNKYYWRTFFNTEEIKIKMINISKGTAQSNLSTIEIMKIKILNSKEVTYNFSEKIKAISKKKLQNEIMILNIEMIKQKLLEELV